MSTYIFETSEIIKDKFIFVSYSHEDSTCFKESTEFLIESGVRLWTDRTFCPADRWEEEAKGLLKHENCSGVIWLCSENSIRSKAVHKELTVAIEQQKKRTKKNYPIFPISVCADGKPNSYVKLLKKSFDLIDIDLIDDKFDENMLENLVSIIKGGIICTMSCNEGYLQVLFDTIKQKYPDVVDKSFIILEKMKETSKKGNADIKFGKRNVNRTSEPIEWQFLCYEGEEALFLSKEILGEDYGGKHLEQWLNDDFKNQAFTADEAEKIIKPLRLLSRAEAEQDFVRNKAKESEWWLSDTFGRRQSIVRNDGTVYANGYNNDKFKKGIRPVIVMSMEQASEINSNQNNG